MKKKSLLIYSLVLILGLSCLEGYHSYAGTALISKGRMEFDNNTPETEDDAIFDVDDLKALDTKISEAEAEINNIETSINNSKQEIVNILNQNPNINIDGEVSFPNIITYIQGSTNVPADTYFYEKGTEGSAAIVRYKKVGGKYYKCDANGKVAQGAQEVNVSGKQLEDYAGTKAGNLSAGAAGYANGGFYLGDGSDNAAYVEQGKQQGIAQTKVGTATPGDVLAGKTFTNSSTVGATGTMPNHGDLNWKPASSTTQTVQPGYYSGGTLDSSAAYSKGMDDADARVNEESASFKKGQSYIPLVYANFSSGGVGPSHLIFDVENLNKIILVTKVSTQSQDPTEFYGSIQDLPTRSITTETGETYEVIDDGAISNPSSVSSVLIPIITTGNYKYDRQELDVRIYKYFHIYHPNPNYRDWIVYMECE